MIQKLINYKEWLIATAPKIHVLDTSAAGVVLQNAYGTIRQAIAYEMGESVELDELVKEIKRQMQKGDGFDSSSISECLEKLILEINNMKNQYLFILQDQEKVLANRLKSALVIGGWQSVTSLRGELDGVREKIMRIAANDRGFFKHRMIQEALDMEKFYKAHG